MTTSLSPELPELLAPAGGWPELRAAVQAGADAVYLGSRELNARRGAANFDVSELHDVVRYAHLRGTRVYLTLNILVLDEELGQAMALADRAADAGVDALIVQDLGLAQRVAERFEGWRLHASTQINAHNSPTLRRLAEWGFARVTLARELGLDQVTRLAREGADAGIEMETFVHGALCYSHSGQCLFTSFVGGRSANRGLCSQACRMPYEVVGRTRQAVRQKGAFPLSMRDLCGLPVLDALAGAGVSALKIEGRMKGPDYVAATVDVYRRALDRLAAGEAASGVPAALAEDTAWLADAFNRGFTTGRLTGAHGADLMSWSRPNNRGVVVGRLDADAEGATLTVRLERAVEPGDVVQVWTGGAQGQAAVTALSSAGGKATRIELDAPVGGRDGDRLVRLERAALATRGEELARKGSGERRIGLAMEADVRLGTAIRVRGRTSDGARAEVVGPTLEGARTVALTADALAEHLGRLGNTVYRLDGFAAELDEGVGLGYGELHRLKDELAAALDAERLEAARPRLSRVEAPARSVAPGPAPSRGTRRAALHVVVRTEAQAQAALKAGADRVSAPWDVASRSGIGLWTPSVLFDAQLDGFAEVLDEWEGPVTVANLGLVRPGLADLASDWRLGVTNEATALRFASIGAAVVGLSPELTLDQATDLARALARRGVGAEILVHGWVEVMTAAQCPAEVLGACGHRCGECPRAEGWALRDAKGYCFPFFTDADGRTHAFNAHELCLAHVLPQLMGAGASLRLDLVLSDPADVRVVVGKYRDLADLAVRDPLAAAAEGERWRKQRSGAVPLTTGHAFRPVA
jgi:putative protease